MSDTSLLAGSRLAGAAELPDDQTISELLELASVTIANSAARSWMGDALAAARAIAAGGPRPSPAEHNVPLNTIERTADRLIAALDELRRHPSAHAQFWRFTAFGPIHGNRVERTDVISALKNIRAAAGKARLRPGRPQNLRKQRIVDLALGFCTRFSKAKPSSDVNNFFPPFAERLNIQPAYPSRTRARASAGKLKSLCTGGTKLATNSVGFRTSVWVRPRAWVARSITECVHV